MTVIIVFSYSFDHFNYIIKKNNPQNSKIYLNAPQNCRTKRQELYR